MNYEFLKGCRVQDSGYRIIINYELLIKKAGGTPRVER